MSKQRKRPGQARSAARRWALQALYQWQLAGQGVAEIETQFLAELGPQADREEDEASVPAEEVDRPYFQELLHGVIDQRERIDGHLAAFIDRPLEQVDPVERAALRLGSYELEFRLDIPYRVVINEAVELAKAFGGEQGHRYVNSVLDKVARVVRADEVGAGRR